MYHDKNLKSIADAVSKVMEGSMKEELKGNQHKIDANKNNKIDAHDFKLLRAGKKVAKEETEQIDELSISPQARAAAKEREKSYHGNTEFPARQGQDLSGHTVSKLKTMRSHHLKTAGYADVSNPEEKGEYHNAIKSARRIKNEIDRRKSMKKEDVDQIEEVIESDSKVGSYTLKHVDSDTNTYHSSQDGNIKTKKHNYDIHDESGKKVGNITHSEHSLVIHHGTSKRVTPAEHHFSGTIHGKKFEHGVPEGKSSKKKFPTIEKSKSSKHKTAHEFLKSHLNVNEHLEEAAADKAAEILAKKREERMEKMDYSKEKTAKSNVRKVEGKYGKEEMNDNDEDDTPKKATKKGVFKRRYNTKVYKEQFSELLDSYVNGGLKGIMENLEVVEVEEQEMISEEVDNETFTKEVEAQKAKAEGKGKKADVAAASVQAVKNEEVEQVEERTLTEPEMKKREEVVKSMKKNLSGFKERYGNRGKEVMYATATKIAKGDK